MRRLLPLALLLLVAPEAWAAIAHVQTQGNAGSGGTLTCTFGLASTSGNEIFVGTGWSTTGNHTASVTDTKGNTYTSSYARFGAAGEGNMFDQQFHAENITGGGAAIVITVTFSASNGETYVVCSEFSGTATTASLDKTSTHSTATDSTAMSSNATATTTQADEVLYGCAGQEFAAISITAQTGWTIPTNGNQGQFACQFQIVSVTGAYTSIPVQSSSHPYASGIATFKAAGGAPPAAPSQLPTLGCCSFFMPASFQKHRGMGPGTAKNVATRNNSGGGNSSGDSGGGGGGAVGDVPCGTTLPCALGWHEIPNTDYGTLSPTYSDIQGIEGPKSVIREWGSGWVDTKRSAVVIFGGGHGGYYGNEVYKLDLTANPIAWSLARDATTGANLTGPAACSNANADGTPNSRHDNDGMVYNPTQDNYFIHGGNLASCGSFSNNYWSLNPTTFAWTNYSLPATHPDPAVSGGASVTAFDPVTNLVYLVDGNDGSGTFWSWNPVTNLWTLLSSSLGNGCQTPGFDHTGVIDPVRRLFFCIGAGKAMKISLNSPFTATSPLAMTGCGTLKSDNGPGLDYYAPDQLIIGWSGGNNLYEYNPDSDSCTTVTPPGTGPGAIVVNGTYKRFGYVPGAGGFAIATDWAKNAWFARTKDQNLDNFLYRAHQPGVIAFQGFDAASDFTEPGSQALTGFHYAAGCPTLPTKCIQRDTTTFLSGSSAARWDIYTNTGEDDEGHFLQQFGQTFAENSTFYVQFAFRADSNWVNTDWTATGSGGTSPKLVIVHGNDVAGQPVTCGTIQTVLRNENAFALPTGYTACGTPNLYADNTDNTLNNAGPRLQSGVTAPAPLSGADCRYNGGAKPVANTCYFFAPNTWYTIYLKIHLGTFGSPNSTIEEWIAPYGTQFKKFINITSGLTINDDVGQGVHAFASLTLTQFMTAKNAANAHPTAKVWYDELIVSTNPIPAPAGVTP